MAKPRLKPGDVLDGFVIERTIHRGGMATLWSVSKPGISIPLLMKVPMLGEGEDPAAIVGFEMEQMIMPRLSGLHVPKFVAAGDFAVQPYIVMEHIGGPTLLLCAHLDTVGVAGMVDPFTLRHEGDRLYGRGAYDMKSGPVNSRSGLPRY